jgi:hypothetical protein
VSEGVDVVVVGAAVVVVGAAVVVVGAVVVVVGATVVVVVGATVVVLVVGGGALETVSVASANFTTPLSMVFEVVAVIRALVTAEGIAFGFDSKYRAASPATWGDAIEVPLLYTAVPEGEADLMLTPGAYMSTHVPKFENEARAS